MKLPCLVRRCWLVAFALGGVLSLPLAQTVRAAESPESSVVSGVSFLTPSVKPDVLELSWQGLSERGSLVDLRKVTPDGLGAVQEVRSSVFQPRGWLVGVEATYLRTTTNRGNSPAFPDTDFGFAGAPRVWIEYVADNSWGVRGAFWTYGVDGQNTYNGTNTSPVPTLFVGSFSDSLEMYAIDLELTRRIYFERSDLWLTLGVRNGRLHRSISGSETRLVPDLGTVTGLASDWDRNFNGTGLTSAVGWRRPFGERNLALFLNFRNSVLWGGNSFGMTSAQLNSVADGTVLNPVLFNYNRTSTSDNSAMWVGELQAGLEWAHDLTGGMTGISAFTRLMFEGQWWATPELGAASVNSEVYNLVGVSAAIGFLR